MPSIFTKIIQRALPAHIVAEDTSFIAFLDVRPLQIGHTLVVPKVEIDDLFDQNEVVLSALLPFARTVAKKIQKVVPCKRIGVAVVGLEVPHTHVHLIPINAVKDMSFQAPTLNLSDEKMAEIAQKIKDA